MKTYTFRLTGITPLIMHKDDVEASDIIAAQRNQMKASGLKTVAGDDRSPAHTWISYLYHNGEVVVMPSDNIMVALRQAGANFKLDTRRTLKAETQSGLSIAVEDCDFFAGPELKAVPFADIAELADVPDFATHKTVVASLGFELFVKRAKIGQAKHVRVRPLFKTWAVEGRITITSENINKQRLQEIFNVAGDRYGLCDWRPGCKTPGPYGRFEAKIK